MRDGSIFVTALRGFVLRDLPPAVASYLENGRDLVPKKVRAQLMK